MEIIYWIVAVWIIVGLVVALVFGLAADKGEDEDGAAGAF